MRRNYIGGVSHAQTKRQKRLQTLRNNKTLKRRKTLASFTIMKPANLKFKTKKYARNLETLTNYIKPNVKNINLGDEIEKVLTHFENFFTKIHSLEKKITKSGTEEELSELDMIKDNIEDKLDLIGDIYTKIRELSPEVYRKVENKEEDNIENYRHLLKKIRKLSDKATGNMLSNISMIQHMLMVELSEAFLNTSEPVEENVDDELMALLKGVSIVENNVNML